MKLLLPVLLLTVFSLKPSTAATFAFPQIVSKNAYMLYGQALEAIFTMGLRLQAIMDTSTDENFVVSPLSTTAIIAQMLIGADGEFREQLHNLLSLPVSTSSFNVTHYSKNGNESQILPYATFHLQLAILIKNLRQRKPGEQFTLNLDNALFYNEHIDLRNVFAASLKKMYNTEVAALDFRTDTRSIINNWASDHTNGLIKSFLSNRLPPNTASLFLNSIYFLAEWETPFADFLNNEDNFQVNPTTSVNTTFMMGNILDIPFTETKDYRLVCLPYKNREVGMYIISPNINHEHKYNIKKFAESINPQEILKSLNNMKPHDVTVKIPKLSLSNSLSILKPLQRYTVFEKVNRPKQQNTNSIDDIVNKVQDFKNFTVPMHEDIYLENASKDTPLRVSDIIQQMVFSINEKGTEAAAVSGGITDYMGGAKTLILNRPFSFFIRHEETQAVIFWGTISNPTKN